MGANLAPVDHSTIQCERQDQAVRAALAVARRHGLGVLKPRVLSDCNNTIVHLAPLPVVAKVCHIVERPCGPAALRRELEVGQLLARAGAPVVPPSGELPAVVHEIGTRALTFWQHREPDVNPTFDCEAAGWALREVHEALATCGAPLQSFLDRQVKRTGRLLADPNLLPSLPASDRVFLAGEHQRLSRELADRSLVQRVLHGDPHAGNFLVSRGHHLVIDFESVCLGPLEWDVSALPDGGAAAFRHEPDLLALLKRLRGICAAVWCMTRGRPVPELGRSAGLHSAVLRGRHPSVETRPLLVA